MGHEINLSNYNIRTDLARELTNQYDVKEEIDDIKVIEVNVDKQLGKNISKKEGTYITIEFEDVTDYDNKEKVKKIFIKYLKKLLGTDTSNYLIIGLGNNKSTPDSLGPITIDNILVTNHLYSIGQLEEGFSIVSAFAPGVTGQSGIETSDYIKCIVNFLHPSCLVVIDSLASQSINRLNKTIQMTTAGISPGGGVGNSRKEISKETIGIPVIAIGVPTVVDATTIVSDTINYIYKHYEYLKENAFDPKNKLIYKPNINYEKENMSKQDKQNLLGIIGDLSDNEVKRMIFEVLNTANSNLLVTPKEEDFLIDKLADIIGNGINQTIHRKVDNL